VRCFFFLCSVIFLISLSGCLESFKADSLSEEIKDLKVRLDSLQRVEMKVNKNRANRYVLSRDSVQAGDGLFQVMARMGISESDRRQIVLGIQDSVELSNLRVGQSFDVAQWENGRVAVFRYAPNPATIHLLFRNPKTMEFEYRRVEKPLTHRQSIFTGVLEEGSTLNGILLKAGIPARMAGIVGGVLQCKIAFKNARSGDHFRVLLEENFYQDSIWISGTVRYAEFNGHIVGHHEAFRYEDSDPKSTFNAHYTESGEALIFDGLRYPLDRLHITSPFGMRIHPVTGKRTMHNGVDYGSPSGSPVYAVAPGTVVTSGYDEFSGNKIAIRHMDHSTSWYLHLSVRGVGVGSKVGARQIIGRVGTTGRSTGPHLHFGFTNAAGKWINPLSKTMIATPKLEGERLARLKLQVRKIREDLRLTEAQQPKLIDTSSRVKVKMRVLQ
jgi:outer membrane murein-binding lipoprotein Lpp